MSERLSNRRRRLMPGLAGAALAVVVGLVLVLPPLDEGLVALSYDSIFWMRSDRSADEAVIVYMDESSHRHLQQPWDRPWDRALHARLIERLQKLGARVIAFDLWFQEPGDPEADQRLISAARAYGRVAVAAVVEPILHGGGLVGWETRQAFPALAEVTFAGVVTPSDSDRAIRRHFFNPTVTNLPSLGATAARLADRMPPGPSAERWLNYYGPPGFLPHVSYHEVFATDASGRLTTLISNKVVFVGAQYSVGFTGGKSTDDFRTPYTRWSGRMSPGVEINATSFLNLVGQDWLRRLPGKLEVALIVATGLGLGFGLGRLRPVSAVIGGVVVAGAVTAVALGMAWTFHVWFPCCVIVLAQVPLALGSSILGQTRRLLREKRAFEQALALTSSGRGSAAETSATRSNSATSGPEVEVPEFLRKRDRSVTQGTDPPDGTHGMRDDLPRIPDHELIRCIGRGGYGDVWLARDIFGAYHAVKLLRLGAFANSAPMLTEFEGLRRFTPISRSHPGLVHVLHVGRDESRACLFYVMELADDASTQGFHPETYAPKTLARELAQRGRLPVLEALELGIQIADALEHLHRHQLVHRDIKPANIVFVQARAKLADAGLVTDAAAGGNGLAFLGTPGRIPPEGSGTPSADIYSLGKVIYETGLGLSVDRFPELPVDMIASGAGRDLFELNRVIMKACDIEARRRYASAAELRDALVALRERLESRIVPS